MMPQNNLDATWEEIAFARSCAGTVGRDSDCSCSLHGIGGKVHWLEVRMVEETTGGCEGREKA